VTNIIELNKQGQTAKVEQEPITYMTGIPQELDYHDVIGDDSLTRFDHRKTQDKKPQYNHNHHRKNR